MRSIAETIGRQLNLPTEVVPAESFGLLGNVFAMDQPASSALTREKFAWQPTNPSLLADLRAGNYWPEAADEIAPEVSMRALSLQESRCPRQSLRNPSSGGPE
jgi:hypothetical protein